MKRFISFVLCAAMLLCTAGYACAADSSWESSVPFTDISPAAAYYDSVVYVYEHGLMNGTGETMFAPDGSSSRAMIATVLWRLAGSPAAETQSLFPDVSDSAWYSEAAVWASDSGVYGGYDDGTFRGETEISLEQLITVIYRYSETNGYDVSYETTALNPTVAVSAWAKPYTDWALATGLVSESDGTEDFTKSAPRSQIAVLLHRFSVRYKLFSSSLTEQSFTADGGSKLEYLLYTPENAGDNMPLIVYLHGGSAKGSDLSLVTEYGFPQYVKSGQLGEISAYIIMPQLSSNLTGWTDVSEELKALVNSVVEEFGIDPDKISLTGHSMGGTGAWGIALVDPDLYSRVAPLSGSIRYSVANVTALSSVSVWAFVGSNDVVVKPAASINFVDALKYKNPTAKVTVFEGAAHADVPQLAYLDSSIGLMDWLTFSEYWLTFAE